MLTLFDVLEGTGGQLVGDLPTDTPFPALQIDSRHVSPGSLFFALPGAATDGHRFLPQAIARGAIAAVVRQDWLAIHPAPPLTVIAVPETLTALHDLASWWRRRVSHLPVVAITGSVGKTSTKEAVAAVLETRFRVHKSPGNLNAITSMPISLLGMTPDTEVAVLEMALYDPGDIATMARIAAPTVGVLTTVGMSHVERFGSPAAIAAEKGDLIAKLPPTGWAVLNGDDHNALATRARTTARVLTFGTRDSCDVRATDVEMRGLAGIRFTLHLPEGPPVVTRSPLLGAHSVYTALAAAAVGHALGLGAGEISRGLAGQQERLRLITVPGPNGSTLIDDTYNSSPQSAIAALNLLKDLDASRRVAVLADMLELGDYSTEAHRRVGAEAADINRLYTLGPHSLATAVAARAAGMNADEVVSVEADDKAALAARLRDELVAGDLVLIKGSRGMHMEDLIAALRTDGANGTNGANGGAA